VLTTLAEGKPRGRPVKILVRIAAGRHNRQENFRPCGEVIEMPPLSTFYGILIQMFWSDHAPPHFHALYAEYEALIDIRSLEVIEGQLPRRAMALVLEWAQEHRAELLEDWELCITKQQPKAIPPLS
jgi:hypothetical protein